MTFLLTPRQEEANSLLASKAQNILLYGGSRSGKTLLEVRAIVTRAIKAPRSRHCILRFRLNAVRRAIVLDTIDRSQASGGIDVAREAALGKIGEKDNAREGDATEDEDREVPAREDESRQAEHDDRQPECDRSVPGERSRSKHPHLSRDDLGDDLQD